MHFQILFLFSCVSTVLTATACNGNTQLCDRLYSEVTMIGTHDSAFVGQLPSDNQAVSVTDQLDGGIRFLQAQTHYFLDGLRMCHTSCLLLDAGPLVDYLSTIKNWLDNNPDQVLTLLLTNGDSRPVSDFGDAITSSGLSSYAYTPGSPLAMGQWPTIQELINSITRIVIFLDYGANTDEVPFILDEFAYFFETPYDTTDASFNECTVDRPPGANAAGRMYIVNHFLDISIFGVLLPDDLADQTTNSPASIESQANLCFGLYGRQPNFVLVDYFNVGDVFAAQDAMNGFS